MSALSELSAMAEIDEVSNELGPDNQWEALEGTEPVEGLYDNQEAMALEPEVRTDLPNCDVAFVIGNPYEAGKSMDYNQGDNPYNVKGNCGLVSISNMLVRAGFDVSETQITGYALENDLCGYSIFNRPEDNGGTTAEKRRILLWMLGIESDICPSATNGSLEFIADAIDEDRGVVISGNAGMLWDVDDGAPVINGKPAANHCVAVTGYARDVESGEIAGVYIADSGRGRPEDACRYLTVEEFDDFYTNAYNSRANITRLPLKGA